MACQQEHLDVVQTTVNQQMIISYFMSYLYIYIEISANAAPFTF